MGRRPTQHDRCLAVVAGLCVFAMFIAGCGSRSPAATAERAVGIIATGCDLVPDIGSGYLTESGTVLTAAHVVAGATRIDIVTATETLDGTIVAFDPDMDIAYLQIDPAAAPAGLPEITPNSEAVTKGAEGTAYVHRDDETVELPVRVDRRITIRTEDIHLDHITERPGFEVTADIRPGDSGGVVVVDGRAVAMVWARSKRVDGRGYLVDIDRAGDTVRAQLAGDARVGDLARRCA